MPITAFRDEYRWLSNFWPAQVKLDGIEYPTVEHAYQAAKTLVPEERAQFSENIHAATAKLLGKRVTLRPDWEQVKLLVMYQLIQQKFEHPDLRTKLIATGNQELIEGNTWHDTFWGICACAKHRLQGENALGQILMEVRRELLLRDEEAAPTREQSQGIYDYLLGKKP